MLGPPASKSLWPFSPQSIPGLSLWLDGADTSSMTFSSGTTVTAWRDKSSTGNNFTGSASYTLDSVYNKYGLSFNGSSNYFSQVNGSLYSITNTTYTVFTVHRFYYDSPSNGVGEVYRRVSSTMWFRQQTGLVNWVTDTTYIQISGTAAALSGIGCINTLTTSSATAYLNGTSVGSGSRGTTTNFPLAIGHAGSGSELLQGAIFEMLVFNTTLSTSQQQQVEGYLAQKWGLQDSLPATHPYYAVGTLPGTVAVSSPTAISGLKLWLDAADASTVTGTTSVTAWADKSGTSNNMSVTSGTVSYASNTMTFASGGIMSSANSTAVVGQQSVVFVVCQPTTIPSAGIGYVFVCSNIASGDYSIRFPTTTSVYATNSGDLGYSPGTYYINGTFGVPSGGTITFPSTPNIIYGLFSTSGTTAFALSTSFLSRYFIGNLYEVIVYTGPITTSQRASVELYLSNKWGIAVTSTIPPTFPSQLYQRPVFQRAFQPVDIPGLSLWLDAADNSSITYSSGTIVSVWKDKSGNGFNATPPIAGPSYSAASQNGLGTLAFDGASTFLLSNVTVNTASHSMFVVHNTASTNTAASGNDNSLLRFQNTVGYIVYPYSNGGRYGYFTSFTGGAAVAVSEGNVAGVYQIMNAVIQSGSLITYHNGSVVSSSSSGLTSVTSDSLSIGAYGIVPYQQQYYQGNIAEIIIFSVPLITSQRQQVESYLAWKWGLVSSLASGHPGKLLPSFSTVFTPKSISGCGLWLDAADSTSITLSGSNVTVWKDKSGSGYSAVPNSGTVTQTTLNGNNVVNFGTAVMRADNFVWSSSFTQIFVGYVATGDIIIDTLSGAYGDYVYTGNGSLMNINTYATNSGVLQVNDSVAGSVAPKNTWFIFSIGYDSTGTAAINYTLNGTVRTTTVFAGSGGSATNAALPLYIGGATAAFGTGVQFAELIHFNVAISTSQRQQIEGYLAWKWGLQNNLPDTHAYKKIRP